MASIVPCVVATNQAGLPTAGLPTNIFGLTADGKRWIWNGTAWQEWLGSLTNPVSDPGALSDETGGTAGATLISVSTLGLADPTKIHNDLASLAAKVNTIRDCLRAHNLML